MLRSAVADLAAAVEDAAVGRWGDKVDGKVRDRLPVPADVAAADLERAALARPAVARAVGDRVVRRVVVRPPHLVNVVLS